MTDVSVYFLGNDEMLGLSGRAFWFELGTFHHPLKIKIAAPWINVRKITWPHKQINLLMFPLSVCWVILLWRGSLYSTAIGMTRIHIQLHFHKDQKQLKKTKQSRLVSYGTRQEDVSFWACVSWQIKCRPSTSHMQKTMACLEAQVALIIKHAMAPFDCPGEPFVGLRWLSRGSSLQVNLSWGSGDCPGDLLTRWIYREALLFVQVELSPGEPLVKLRLLFSWICRQVNQAQVILQMNISLSR